MTEIAADATSRGWAGMAPDLLGVAFAKALQILEEDPDLYERMDRWMEALDWIVWQLCGEEVRNACAAGYKSMYQEGEYPSTSYFAALDQRFANSRRTNS